MKNSSSEIKTEQTKMAQLFWTFAQVGVLTFGGGMAMLPILQREVVDKHRWVTEDELLDYFAIAQVTPGIIAVNVATFVGKKERGIAGGILATLGVVAPSVVIITVIAAILSSFADLVWVQNAFAAIRACVCVLILNAWVKLAKKTFAGPLTYVIAGVTCIGTLVLPLSPIVYVLVAGLLGVFVLGKGGGGK